LPQGMRCGSFEHAGIRRRRAHKRFCCNVFIVGDIEQGRALARAMLCQLAAFHSLAHVHVIAVSSTAPQWEWAKRLPHLQREPHRDGCGEQRMLFSSPAQLEAIFHEDPDGWRQHRPAPRL